MALEDFPPHVQANIRRILNRAARRLLHVERVGARVRLIEPEGDWPVGTVGTVTRVGESAVVVDVDGERRDVPLSKVDVPNPLGGTRT